MEYTVLRGCLLTLFLHAVCSHRSPRAVQVLGAIAKQIKNIVSRTSELGNIMS